MSGGDYWTQSRDIFWVKRGMLVDNSACENGFKWKIVRNAWLGCRNIQGVERAPPRKGGGRDKAQVKRAYILLGY